MKHIQVLVLAFALTSTVHVFGDANSTEAKAPDGGGNSAVPSDFFADALAKALGIDRAQKAPM